MIAMYPHNRTWKSNQKDKPTLGEHNRMALCLLAVTVGLNLVTLLLWILRTTGVID